MEDYVPWARKIYYFIFFTELPIAYYKQYHFLVI